MATDVIEDPSMLVKTVFDGGKPPESDNARLGFTMNGLSQVGTIIRPGGVAEKAEKITKLHRLSCLGQMKKLWKVKSSKELEEYFSQVSKEFS